MICGCNDCQSTVYFVSVEFNEEDVLTKEGETGKKAQTSYSKATKVFLGMLPAIIVVGGIAYCYQNDSDMADLHQKFSDGFDQVTNVLSNTYEGASQAASNLYGSAGKAASGLYAKFLEQIWN